MFSNPHQMFKHNKNIRTKIIQSNYIHQTNYRKSN